MSARKNREARLRRQAAAQDKARKESRRRPGRLDDPDYIATVGAATVVTGDPILGVLAGELFR